MTRTQKAWKEGRAAGRRIGKNFIKTFKPTKRELRNLDHAFGMIFSTVTDIVGRNRTPKK